MDPADRKVEGSRLYHVTVARAWNSLPTNVSASTSLPSLRDNLKHFYLPNLYH